MTSGKECALSEKTLALSSQNWRQEVEESPLPVLVDFTASWCPPCHAIAPTIDALAAEFAGRLKVGNLDVDSEPELAERYSVRAMPTLLILDHGKVVDQRLGAAPPQVLRAFVAEHAAPTVGVTREAIRP